MVNVQKPPVDFPDRPSLVVQGRTLSSENLEHIRSLLVVQPPLNRRRISIELAQKWNWRTAIGQLKDMAARTLLLKLHRRGIITLPPCRKRSHPAPPPVPQPWLFQEPAPTPIQEPLSDLTPLRWDVISARHPQRKIFSALLARHHYLGYGGPVGENIAYLVRDRHDRPLACLLFGAAAWKTHPRDLWIGWDPLIRQRRLPFVVNNSRFLILPWVRVPHLASHILARSTRRLCMDWQTKYGHPIYLVETFVDHERFRGTCYRAANWVHVGQTQGRSRQDRTRTLHVPIKDVYLHPLSSRFREELCRVDG